MGSSRLCHRARERTSRWRAALIAAWVMAVVLILGLWLGQSARAGMRTKSRVAAGEHRVVAAPTGRGAHSAAALQITVGSPAPVHAIPASFVGVSLEYYELAGTLGSTTANLDRIFGTLVKKLASVPSIRIGGESADWTWVPTAGVKPPGPVNFTLTNALISTLAATARNLDARYLLDLNLAADNPRLTDHEGWALYRAIGRRYIQALEIGNEPELYGSESWSRPPLAPILARPRSYGIGDYLSEFDALAAALPPIATAGPATGNSSWADALSTDRTGANRLGLVTIHRYALSRCGLQPSSPAFPTVPKLLAPATAFTLAASIKPVVAAAHAHGLPVRVDEVGDAPCFGVEGVSNTFASALWALQTSFALASTGVDGVNFHTEPAAAHRLFNFWQTKGTWHASVFPIYYGLLMFNWAAPAGSHLLDTHGSTSSLTAWATTTGASTRVVLINSGSARSVDVDAPGHTETASVIRLVAPSAAATHGVTIAGASFPAASTTGQLSPKPVAQTLAPATSGHYAVSVAADSALLLTLTR